MNHKNPSLVCRGRDRQSGQSIVLIPVLLVALLAAAALVIDTSNLYYSYQQLQVATQAAALAGGAQLPSASAATTAANNYSALSGKLNAQANGSLTNVAMVSGYPQTKCLSSIGIDCNAGSPNAIVVKQSADVQTFFAKIFGISKFTITATATASSKGGGTGPFNVEIILDTTQSMNSNDNNCTVPGIGNPTREDCAVYGVQTLLKALAPCSSSLASCGTATNGDVPNPVDEVGLMAFPGLTTTAQAAYDYDCASSPQPAVAPYKQTSPNTPVYQIVGFSSDFRASDTATTLVTTSNIVKAARAGATGCTQGIDAVGGEGTFYADAISVAQSALIAEQTARTALGVSSTNVIILVSDGQAGSNSAPTSEANNQCAEAVTAAQAAANTANNGTWVYSVAYGSTNSGCTTDTGTYASSCNTMKAIANSPGNIPDSNKFYSDSGTGGACPSTHNVTALSSIFADIAGDLTVARLLPNGTT